MNHKPAQLRIPFFVEQVHKLYLSISLSKWKVIWNSQCIDSFEQKSSVFSTL